MNITKKFIFIALIGFAPITFAKSAKVMIGELEQRVDALQQEQQANKQQQNQLIIELQELSTTLGNEIQQQQVVIELLSKQSEQQQQEILASKIINKQLSSRIENSNKKLQANALNHSDFKETVKANQSQLASDLAILGKDLNVKLESSSLSINKSFNKQLESTEASTKERLSQIQGEFSQHQIYWLAAFCIVIILSLTIYYLLIRRIQKSKLSVEDKIANTRKLLEEEAVKLDGKLVELLETQLKIIDDERQQSISGLQNEEADHSLALKVADEVTRIQNNLGRMDSNIKGLKQLSGAVKRIQDNFAAKGYEIVDMLGNNYNDGLKITPSFMPSDELEAGQQIITRIIKPQVNFEGVMIQSAQVEVSVGE